MAKTKPTAAPVEKTTVKPPVAKTAPRVTKTNPAPQKNTVTVTKTVPSVLPKALPMPRPKLWPWLWIAVPTMAGGMWWWWTLEKLLAPRTTAWNVVELLWYISMALIAVAAMLGPAMLGGFLITSRRWVPIFGTLAAAQVLWFFAFNWASVVALVITAVGIWVGSEGVRRETASRLRMDIRSSLAHVMAWVILAVSISVSVLHFSAAQQAANPTADVNRLISRIVSVSERLLDQFYPAYDPKMTVDELIGEQIPTTDDLLSSVTNKTNWSGDERQSIIDRLASLGVSGLQVPPAGAKLDQVRTALDRELAAARSEMLAELRNGVSQQLGITLNGAESVHDALVQLVDSRVRARGSAFIKFLPPILSLSVFLALRLFSPFLELVVVGMGWLWFAVLRFAHILRIETVPATAERIKWGSH